VSLFLLDTDAIIDFLNGHPPTVSLLRELPATDDTLCVCSVSVAEVYAGIGFDAPAESTGWLETCRFLPSTLEIARLAGAWRFNYARQGIQLSTTDVLVAATALFYNATLVTGNVRHFPMSEVSVLRLPR
jgi:predicted nucleic acid-binding protein